MEGPEEVKDSWIMSKIKSHKQMEMTTYKSIYRGALCGWFIFSAIALTTSRVKIGFYTALSAGFLSYTLNSVYLKNKEETEKAGYNVHLINKEKTDKEDWMVERVSTDDS